MTFNNLEWPLTRISTSGHCSTLNISETTRDRATFTFLKSNIVKTKLLLHNRKLYLTYGLVLCLVTLTDLYTCRAGLSASAEFFVLLLCNCVITLFIEISLCVHVCFINVFIAILLVFFLCILKRFYPPPLIGGDIKRCFCLTSDVDVRLSRTSGLSREQRGLWRPKLAWR